MKTSKITGHAFAKIFGTEADKLSQRTKEAIEKANFRYRVATTKECEQVILKILKTLDSETLKKTGPHRRADWEKGWKENLHEYKKFGSHVDLLIPKFVKKREFIRFQGNIIWSESDSFETDFVTVLRYYLFTTYLKNVQTIYEFGAGTGLNLVAASEVFPEMKLVGLDWAIASIEIMNTLKETLGIHISAKKFNLFAPDTQYKLRRNCAVLTIGTLEQLGRNFKPFIRYLLANKPSVCIHVETLYEMYDRNSLLDYLAIQYLERRNYLRGFLPYMRELEKKGKITIVDVRKTFGSLYHDGYTYLVWKPL